MPSFIFLMKANVMAEAPPAEIPPEVFESMNKYNEELNDAGVLLDAQGLRPTSVDSYRLTYSTDNTPEVNSGPFHVATETHICGWWIVQTKDAEEALSWAKKIPMQSGEIVVRRIACVEELGDGFTKQLREREAKLRIQMAKRVLELAQKDSDSI
ncbi:dgpfaetke family protein [Trichoderma sp. SZMC 28013]